MSCLLYLLLTCDFHCNFHIWSVSCIIYRLVFAIVISIYHCLLHWLSTCDLYCNFYIWSAYAIFYRLKIFIVISIYDLSPPSFIDLWYSFWFPYLLSTTSLTTCDLHFNFHICSVSSMVYQLELDCNFHI